MKGSLIEDGYLILPDLLDPATVDIVKAELDPWLHQTPRCEGDFYGWTTTRVGGLLDKAPSVQDLVLDPRILPMVESVLAPACDCIQLNLTQAVRIHPGERAQAPHRDEEMWPAEKQNEWLVNVMWAIDDFTEDNGATRLWPGSHCEDLDRSVDMAHSVPALMRRGSALIFLGSLTHCGGANQSTAPRTGIIISYCLGWLKQYENQFLAYPPSVVRSFPKALQRLIGYQMHRPNLGGWEGQDPIAFLQDDRRPRPHVDALTPQIASELAALYEKNGGQKRAEDGD